VIRSFVLALALCAGATPALAQTSPPSAEVAPVREVTFLSRYAFQLGAEHIRDRDPRYVWDANYGGELDVVDYGQGRMTLYANYQAILGEQLRIFDPNQGNYILGGVMTVRRSGIEIGGGFHHESRHLSDREKEQPVDWNMIGFHLGAAGKRGRAEMAASGDARYAIRVSFVDYDWEVASDARIAYAVTPRVGLVASGRVDVLGTENSPRSTQTGVRVEGGMRLAGEKAAVELFLACERRVDPYPLELGTASWFSAGFRVTSR
jgi:hypothetical protein